MNLEVSHFYVKNSHIIVGFAVGHCENCDCEVEVNSVNFLNNPQTVQWLFAIEAREVFIPPSPICYNERTNLAVCPACDLKLEFEEIEF